VRDALLAARGKAGPRLMVRVNGLDTGLTDADLDGIMVGAPFAIMLPKATGGPDVSHLAAKLAVREAEMDLPDGGTGILPICTETAKSIFGLGTYGRASHRLLAMTWGAEDLSADIGAERNRAEDGRHAGPFRLARDLMLMGAAAAQVDAIDTVFTAFRDTEGLLRECLEARADGFTGKMAIHPAQVPVINAAFTPDDAAIARARAIVAAFAADPEAGVVGLDGEMLDLPHLTRARRLLARIGEI
jgi:citrate lyase subunit beta/citryl-CoA lyase